MRVIIDIMFVLCFDGFLFCLHAKEVPLLTLRSGAFTGRLTQGWTITMWWWWWWGNYGFFDWSCGTRVRQQDCFFPFHLTYSTPKFRPDRHISGRRPCISLKEVFVTMVLSSCWVNLGKTFHPEGHIQLSDGFCLLQTLQCQKIVVLFLWSWGFGRHKQGNKMSSKHKNK